MSWSIEYKGELKSIADWGLSGLKFRQLNQGQDRLTFIQEDHQIEAEELFASDSELKVFKDGRIWFIRRVIRTPSMGDVCREEKFYEVAGPWWYLEHLVYQQMWANGPKSNVPSSRVILGQNDSGDPIHAGIQVKAIFEYAIAQGVPISVGAVGLDIEIPYDEVKDISCAEAINRVLRWVPDSVVWFDYSIEVVPKIFIQKRSSLKSLSLCIAGECSVRRLSITPRHDLVLPGVVIKYEQKSKLNNRYWVTTQEDKFPKSISDKDYKALVMKVELDGGGSVVLKQRVEAHPISIHSLEWGKAHMPILESAKQGSVRVEGAHRRSHLPNELIHGGISRWMPVSVEEDVIRAKISYETSTEKVVQREVVLKVYATDAETRSYHKVFSTMPAESVPKGLSEQIYKSVSQLHFDGYIELESAEVGYIELMGRVLNLNGGRAEWRAMRALIQEVRLDIDLGRTFIRFGPPKHLGADDMIELLQMNRRRKASRSALRRWSRGRSQASTFEQATHNRLESKDFSGGGYSRLEFLDPKEANRKLVLDAEHIVKDATLQLREDWVSENGALRKRLILASEPYSETYDNKEKG